MPGLLRCGKSCRLRWTNYLRPDIKRGPFTPDEQKSIIQLHGIVGNKWSTIAAQLPGRTDNEIKNYWNTHLKKHLLRMGINPETYAPSSSPTSIPSESTAGPGGGTSSAAAAAAAAPSSSTTRHMAQWESARLEAEARHSRESILFSTSGAAAAASPGHSGGSGPPKVDADFFLRMWNSDVGEAFRSKEATSATGVSPASSSTKCSSSAQLVVAIKKEELEEGKLSGGGAGGSIVSSGEGEPNKEDVDSKSSVSGRVDGGSGGNGRNTADSSSSNEVEEATSEEETYQMYLNFMGEDMAQLFHGGLDSISLFGSDLNEASLDIAFK
ncbi:hypothetical protein Taro_031150 [Colocasia esculenta]|uniref:Uncharacterized protein n=1 Tax=Colocasia esculenta TaxID=4460 RepID=A0A843VPB0_COLES|nr:hypothetical protein [Colocasia esculenta]